MNIKRINWPVWAGLLLSLFALFTYGTLFVQWPLTRDFPWANLLLFGTAMVLLLIGLRRAFAPDRRWPSRVAALLVFGLSALALAFFIFAFFVAARWLPVSAGAPQVGQK